MSRPPVRQYSSASSSNGARSSVSPLTRGGTVSSRSMYSRLARRGFVDRVVGGLVQAGIPLVEDRRDLDEALGNVGLLAAAERDDCELPQQGFAVADTPGRRRGAGSRPEPPAATCPRSSPPVYEANRETGSRRQQRTAPVRSPGGRNSDVRLWAVSGRGHGDSGGRSRRDMRSIGRRRPVVHAGRGEL